MKKTVAEQNGCTVTLYLVVAVHSVEIIGRHIMKLESDAVAMWARFYNCCWSGCVACDICIPYE